MKTMVKRSKRPLCFRALDLFYDNIKAFHSDWFTSSGRNSYEVWALIERRLDGESSRLSNCKVPEVLKIWPRQTTHCHQDLSRSKVEVSILLGLQYIAVLGSGVYSAQ